MDVASYIKMQKSPQKEVCQKLRHIIFETFPNITEAMKWGVIGFSDGLFYIVALKDHVNLGFSSKQLTSEELKLFDGGGKTTRNLEVTSVETIDKERIIKLLHLVMGKKE